MLRDAPAGQYVWSESEERGVDKVRGCARSARMDELKAWETFGSSGAGRLARRFYKHSAPPGAGRQEFKSDLPNLSPTFLLQPGSWEPGLAEWGIAK